MFGLSVPIAMLTQPSFLGEVQGSVCRCLQNGVRGCTFVLCLNVCLVLSVGSPRCSLEGTQLSPPAELPCPHMEFPPGTIFLGFQSACKRERKTVVATHLEPRTSGHSGNPRVTKVHRHCLRSTWVAEESPCHHPSRTVPTLQEPAASPTPPRCTWALPSLHRCRHCGKSAPHSPSWPPRLTLDKTQALPG